MGERGDLFKQIKALRRSSPVVSTCIDGNSSNIPEHFRSIYSKLYNSTDDAEKLCQVNEYTKSIISPVHLQKIDQITPALLKDASKRLKPGKSDQMYAFSSDCFRNGPDILYDLLSWTIRCCILHNHINDVLLISTLVPLVKDRLGNINSSKNYRSVAISSILLKLLDWVVILLDGEHLRLNDLQFAYQRGLSTTMCTWAALETVDYYLRNGSEVFTCATDMTKAFDMTLHSLMFSKMLKAGVCPLFVRMLIYVYANQEANVRWNGLISENFEVRNGCGQGKVLAAIAYCLYCEDLFALLKRRRSGCWVGGYYCGIFGYSDDNWVLAPSLSALQDILRTLEEYAGMHNLKFSTDADPIKCKTKCLAFLKKDRELPKMVLCGDLLPWVSSLTHLGVKVGNVINGCQADLVAKNACYIQANCSIVQEFRFAHPKTKMKINEVYNCHFSGSNLWNLFSHNMKNLESSYNRSIRIMSDLPLQTHRYSIEPLTGAQHVKFKILKNYLTFIATLRKSSRPVLRQLYLFASNDVQSITGNNLRNILLLTKN